MKKSLVALAALAVAGVASAQSSVTLFGVVDAGVSGYSNKSDNNGFFLVPPLGFVDSVKVKRTVLSNSCEATNPLVFIRSNSDRHSAPTAAVSSPPGKLASAPSALSCAPPMRKNVFVSAGFTGVAS